MSDKPSYLGLLNAVSLAETAAHEYLTAWAAVSVCEVVRETVGLQARIKWPNDVLIRGRKVCGILIEQVHQGGALASVVAYGEPATITGAVACPEAQAAGQLLTIYEHSAGSPGFSAVGTAKGSMLPALHGPESAELGATITTISESAL